MRLTGSYLELTDRIPGRLPGKASDSTPAERQDAADRRPELLISVAKRLVRSAVRRNTVKRIVREAWRAATDDGIARQDSQAGRRPGGTGDETAPAAGASVAVRSPRQTCLVRLKRYPGTGADPKPGFRMIKRSLRQDADRLFAMFLARRK